LNEVHLVKGYSLTAYTILLLTSDLAITVYKSLDLLLITRSEFYLVVINV